MRVAAIDCGTNSIRLLVADGAAGAGPSHPGSTSSTTTQVLRRVEVVRLGYGVDATGVISAESMGRALAMTREYAAVCAQLGVEAVKFVTTSAARDARNAHEFISGVRQAFADTGMADVAPQVLSGEQEAYLSFLGATGDLASDATPYLVVDLGGGSTEFVRGGGDAAGGVDATLSVDMGCVRMSERYLRESPPSGEAIAAALADIDAHLDRVDQVVGLAGVGTLVGVAGTVTTLTAHALRLPAYDSDSVHLARLDIDEVLRACGDMLAADRSTLAALPYMHPGRVDVIAAGALIWARTIARVTEASGIDSVLTSEHDILDGIALSLLRAR